MTFEDVLPGKARKGMGGAGQGDGELSRGKISGDVLDSSLTCGMI